MSWSHGRREPGFKHQAGLELEIETVHEGHRRPPAGSPTQSIVAHLMAWDSAEGTAETVDNLSGSRCPESFAGSLCSALSLVLWDMNPIPALS